MDKAKAVAEAVRAVLDAVQGADAQEMLGKRPKPKVEVEVEAGGEGAEHEADEMELLKSLEGLHEDDDDVKDGPPMMRRGGY